jgi:hypothetical protein
MLKRRGRPSGVVRMAMPMGQMVLVAGIAVARERIFDVGGCWGRRAAWYRQGRLRPLGSS